MFNRVRVHWILIAAALFVVGVASTALWNSQPVEAQAAAANRPSELPPVFQPNAKVFLQTPDQLVGNAYTVRDVSGSWVLIEYADGGNRTFQQYWVHAPSFAWGVGGAFKTEPK